MKIFEIRNFEPSFDDAKYQEFKNCQWHSVMNRFRSSIPKTVFDLTGIHTFKIKHNVDFAVKCVVSDRWRIKNGKDWLKISQIEKIVGQKRMSERKRLYNFEVIASSQEFADMVLTMCVMTQ